MLQKAAIGTALAFTALHAVAAVNEQSPEKTIDAQKLRDAEKALTPEAREAIDEAFKTQNVREAVSSFYSALISSFANDGKTLRDQYFGEFTNLAACGGPGADCDSTNVGGGFGYGSTYTCYSNCHGACHGACHWACHGSRGWR